ncbi:TPA: hypothetical protein ACKRUW_002947 [Proteus mirabilis]|uniref:hypothetical protein n=1 Tax=Proteus mirabilis TaxID=584 RepID=UPI001596E711|nr:hypothetical protein [Proteus mirabilis]
MDIVLNLEILAAGNEYASLAQQLKARGFTRWVEEGQSASWRWRRRVNDNIEVVVELLRDAGDEEPGRTISVDGKKYLHLQSSMLELFTIGIRRRKYLPNSWMVMAYQ